MIGRPVLAALLLGLWVRSQETTSGGTVGVTGSGAAGEGDYKFDYKPSGATVPIWSDIGRAMILLFAGAPTKADEFGKDVLASPGTGGIRSALASHQGIVGIFTLLNYVLMAVVVLGGLGIVGARFAKRCGGQRMQVITPEYDDYYQYYLIAVGLTGGALMIAAVCLFLNKADLGSALNDGHAHYDAGVNVVKTFISGGAGDVSKPTGDSTTGTGSNFAPGSTAQLRRLADTLNARFRDEFLELLRRRAAMDAGLPSRDVLSECGSDAKSVSRLLSAQGLSAQAALLSRVGRRCERLGRSREAAYGQLARAVEDASVVGRKQLLRRVLWLLKRAEDETTDAGIMMSQTMGGFDAVLQRLSKYEADGGTVSWLNFISGLPMLFVVLVTLAAPMMAMVGMGVASRDHDLRPTVRSPQSNVGGLLLVYSAAAGLVCAMVSVYIYGLMYAVSAAGEIYVCEPFRSRSFKPLDELAYMLWPLSERGQAFAALVPSEVLTKCPNGAALSELVVPAGFSAEGDAKGNETAKEPKEPSPAPAILQLRDEPLANATTSRDARRALRSLVVALVRLGPRVASPSLRANLTRLSRKWKPLARPDGNASASDVSFLERCYLEYMSDVESRLRWASAELSRQGSSGGGCEPVFRVLQASLELLCDTFLSGCEGFWLAQVLLFLLLAVFAPLCLGLANHFLVMENYMYRGFDDKKVKRREEKERLGLVKKKKKKKKKEEDEEDESEMDSSEGDDSTASDTSE
ncbi:hypothetical protein HPB47_023161 [Ixodes persulcatus]|uniref:Uncharacterized protein n=1 Tax=Ixodes persulcatus TaxID=34615 RepID=A0AC60Q9S2_IXOPE|nr:hypothetical protein HPB47_023161 [Ixodes persulcatus]